MSDSSLWGKEAGSSADPRIVNLDSHAEDIQRAASCRPEGDDTPNTRVASTFVHVEEWPPTAEAT
jgi:hypothetical protein